MTSPDAAPSPDSGALPGPQFIRGLGAIADRYDGFILDLWGVLHDGTKPYPGAVDTLRALIAAGKRIAILSNAPRRAADVIQRMTEIGIPTGLYHHVMSSGEETWRSIAERRPPFHATLGERCYHIGPPRDDGLLAGLGLTRVATIGEAQFILNTGPWGWEEQAEHYEARLREAQGRDLPMVCANPDLVVMHGDRMAICAGTLAERYEALGGRVHWHGKPYASVYETCFALLEIADRRRIIAVGDSLRTDIAGANGVGIDCVLVSGGIHAEEFGMTGTGEPDPARVRAAVARTGRRPTAVLPHFTW